MKCVCGFSGEKKDFFRLTTICSNRDSYLIEPNKTEGYRIKDSLYICPECGTVRFPIEEREALYY